MNKIDINKEHRDGLDDTVEHKFLLNLQWSMLFFCFNQICNNMNKENEYEDPIHIQKEFIKLWKKFAHKNITTIDLKIINDILNSPKNSFYAALQNSDEVTESTEVYQEKYNKIISKIEDFFLQSIKNSVSSENDE